MASPQQEEYLRRVAQEEQRKQQRDVQRRKREKADYIATHWKLWAKCALFSAAGLIAVYYSWVYLWPLLFPYKPEAMEELTIEEVAAEFRDDPEEAAKKYEKNRVIVEGRFVKIKDKLGGEFPYFQLRDTKGDEGLVRCEFFDIDEAGTTDPGEGVRLSGVIQRDGPRKIKIVGAAPE